MYTGGTMGRLPVLMVLWQHQFMVHHTTTSLLKALTSTIMKKEFLNTLDTNLIIITHV